MVDSMILIAPLNSPRARSRSPRALLSRSTLRNFDDRTRAHVRRTLLQERVEDGLAHTRASIHLCRRSRITRVYRYVWLIAFCEVVTLCLPPFLRLSLPSPSPSLSFAYCHARIFTRVVFLSYMLAFRDTGGTAQKPRYIYIYMSFVLSFSFATNEINCFVRNFRSLTSLSLLLFPPTLSS